MKKRIPPSFRSIYVRDVLRAIVEIISTQFALHLRLAFSLEPFQLEMKTKRLHTPHSNAHQRAHSTHTYKSLNYINTNVRQSAQMNNKPNESLLKKNQLEINNKTNNNKIYRKVNSKTRKQLKWKQKGVAYGKWRSCAQCAAYLVRTALRWCSMHNRKNTM